jgi:hypothetical protein
MSWTTAFVTTRSKACGTNGGTGAAKVRAQGPSPREQRAGAVRGHAKRAQGSVHANRGPARLGSARSAWRGPVRAKRAQPANAFRTLPILKISGCSNTTNPQDRVPGASTLAICHGRRLLQPRPRRAARMEWPTRPASAKHSGGRSTQSTQGRSTRSTGPIHAQHRADPRAAQGRSPRSTQGPIRAKHPGADPREAPRGRSPRRSRVRGSAQPSTSARSADEGDHLRRMQGAQRPTSA